MRELASGDEIDPDRREVEGEAGDKRGLCTNFATSNTQLDSTATSFRSGVDFAVGGNWAVVASKKVRG